MIERWTTRSGPRIHYLDSAPDEPHGLPLLFSPGLSDTADEYAEMLDVLLPRRVLVVEVRGRGRSEAPPAGYAAEDHTADLAAVLDEEGIDRFHLLTFSRGTTWGLGLVAQRPHAVASLAIADYRAAEVGLPEGFAESQRGARFRGRPLLERMPFHVLDGIATASRSRDLWDDVAALDAPLLVLRPGGAGGMLRDDDVARYREARPDVEIVVVPDAPHDVFRPDRSFVPKVVAEFLDRVEA